MKPGIEAYETELSRTIVARFDPGVDIFEGIREICREKGISSGTITTMLGSLRSATLVCVTPDPTRETGARYFEPIEIEGPLELIGAQGMIGLEEEQISVHLHGTVGTDEMEPVAGHMVDNGRTLVLATMELVIQGFGSVDLIRSYDEETEFVRFDIIQKPKGRL